MIKHIVMWKFKQGKESEMRRFLDALENLRGQIDVIRSLETGVNILGKDNCDAVLIATFDSVEDLEKYKNDPRHIAASSLCREIREARYAHGKAGFISKLQIALKEANETGYWIELLYRTDYISEARYKTLDSACTSIRVLLISSINTAKQNAQ